MNWFPSSPFLCREGKEPVEGTFIMMKSLSIPCLLLPGRSSFRGVGCFFVCPLRQRLNVHASANTRMCGGYLGFRVHEVAEQASETGVHKHRHRRNLLWCTGADRTNQTGVHSWPPALFRHGAEHRTAIISVDLGRRRCPTRDSQFTQWGFQGPDPDVAYSLQPREKRETA